MQSKEHWERVYSTKASDAVSWFQEHAALSLQLILDTQVPLSSSIIDVGGGASVLCDELLQAGFEHVTVLDLSGAALLTAQQRLGKRAEKIQWIEADVTQATLPESGFDIWHDRAVFHFLTNETDRQAYVAQVMKAVKLGGHVIVATFAEDGPLQCSGLPVQRYDADGLHAEFGESFQLLDHQKESHTTPFGTIQQFVYCYCRKLK